MAISYLIDRSASAENDKQFQLAIKRGCQTLAKSIEPDDEFGVISVTGEAPLVESLLPASPPLVRKECQQPIKSTKPGTLSCPAFSAAKKQFQGSTKTPLLIVHVQVNENENSCPEIWRSTAQLVLEREGSVILLNSTNEGGESFRPELEAAFGRLRVQYSTNPEIAIKKAIQEIRNKKTEVKDATQ